MPEAPPSSPGHAGHTPQHLPEILRRNRLQGILTANLPRYTLAYTQRLFLGRLPQLQRGIRNHGPFQVLAAIDDYQRRVGAAGPSKFPLAYQEGMEAPKFTRQPPQSQ